MMHVNHPISDLFHDCERFIELFHSTGYILGKKAFGNQSSISFLFDVSIEIAATQFHVDEITLDSSIDGQNTVSDDAHKVGMAS